MDLQIKINEAWKLKKDGKKVEALKRYNEIFNALCQEPTEYAKKFKETTQDDDDTRKILPKYFEKALEYLRRDDIACKISNNMGTILAELGDIDGARKMFEQAVDLTPDDTNYPDPRVGLEELK